MSINWLEPIQWSTGERTQVVYDDGSSKTVDPCEAWNKYAGGGIVGVSTETGEILGCEGEGYPHIENVAPQLSQREETLCEAAMCMWEQALALFQMDPQWKDYVEGVGYGQARMDVVEHVAELQADYEAVADDYNMCFDWDFVPAWMAANLVISPIKGLYLQRPPSGDQHFWRLQESEAGDVLYDKQFGTDTELQAEHFQRDRWNDNYCVGEPRVTSELFQLVDGDWKLVMSMGV